MALSSIRVDAIVAFVIGAMCICETNANYTLPSYITACYDLVTECLTRTANGVLERFCAGIPELGVRPLDPYPVEKLKLNLLPIAVQFGPGTITGLRKCNIDKLAVKLEKRKFHLQATCNVTVKGKYKTKGRLLTFNLDGDGDAKIKIKKMVIKTVVNYVFEEVEGETYIKLTDYTHSSKVLGSAHFDLTNLLRGNKELGALALNFINQNWRDLYPRFSGPIIDKAVSLVVKNIGNFMEKFPRRVLTPGFETLYKGKY